MKTYHLKILFFSNIEIARNPLNTRARADPRVMAFLHYAIFKKQKLQISTSLYFGRRWSSLFLVRLFDFTGAPAPGTFFTVSVARFSFYVPAQFDWKPFKDNQLGLLSSVTISAGIGPNFLLGDNSQRINFDLGLLNDRGDDLFFETWYQFQKKSHRRVTFDYTVSFAIDIFRDIGVQLNLGGNLGDITKSDLT